MRIPNYLGATPPLCRFSTIYLYKYLNCLLMKQRTYRLILYFIIIYTTYPFNYFILKLCTYILPDIQDICNYQSFYMLYPPIGQRLLYKILYYSCEIFLVEQEKHTDLENHTGIWSQSHIFDYFFRDNFLHL